MPTTPNATILVADDTAATTLFLQRVFEYEGYRVHSVHDGHAALETAKQLLPDLILLDVRMPGLNGFEVLRQLRETPLTASIPTILMTAHGEISDTVQGLNLGADDYVRKPFHWRELMARAESKMRARKLESQLQRRTHELEALLRVSEELSKYLELDQVLDLILRLSLELLPGDATTIYRLDRTGNITHLLQHLKSEDKPLPKIDHQAFIDQILPQSHEIIWSSESPLIPNLPNGLVVPLQYSDEGDKLLQIVMCILSEEIPYDSNHGQLANGIARQAALALKNAELYQWQANYASRLKVTVEERTRDLQSAQNMLIRSEKLASVGRLAASIAHEINNPLFPIRVNLDNMLEDLQAQNPIDQRDIVIAQECVDRIHRIVQRLLEFTGKDHSQVSFTPEPIQINEVIENVIALIRKSMEQQNQKIDLNLDPLPLVLGSKDSLEQVFMNFVINASEAMPTGGRLTINTRQEAREIVITVSDTGKGIHADIVETIFEPFVSTKEDGNGLGLFISYGIIQHHYGSIEVHSELNVGTTFTVKLPIGAEELKKVKG
ncbi:MAG: response regulator [Anaerolineae bacterium]|jgi:signal transduction histidine kinase/CheY-like chemotaxis protein|nr:response regulator [Anaerolineae bacterium]